MSQNSSEFCLVYITCPDEKSSLKVASELVGLKLAACANVFPKISSLYRWEGNIQTDSESVLILKTRSNLIERLCEKVSEIHPYECPCVVSLPIQNGNPTFLGWLNEQTEHC